MPSVCRLLPFPGIQAVASAFVIVARELIQGQSELRLSRESNLFGGRVGGETVLGGHNTGRKRAGFNGTGGWLGRVNQTLLFGNVTSSLPPAWQNPWISTSLEAPTFS